MILALFIEARSRVTAAFRRYYAVVKETRTCYSQREAVSLEFIHVEYTSLERESDMKKSHRTNVLVTSCLKTPVDPHTKVPLAQYERERSLPRAPVPALTDNRRYEKEVTTSCLTAFIID